MSTEPTFTAELVADLRKQRDRIAAELAEANGDLIDTGLVNELLRAELDVQKAWNKKVFEESTFIVKAHGGLGEGGHTIDRLIVLHHAFKKVEAELAAYKARLAEAARLLERVTMNAMGGTPDLFWPMPGWEEFDDDVTTFLAREAQQ